MELILEQLPGWKLPIIMTCNKESFENFRNKWIYLKIKIKTHQKGSAFLDPKNQLNFLQEIQKTNKVKEEYNKKVSLNSDLNILNQIREKKKEEERNKKNIWWHWLGFKEVRAAVL